ncbi:type II toxin-antitoxin system RelE/ParE family toxin [Candidatus Shapirobacteria bacterium]|nr:type II toxin-antitoxin system RelE/ParE family toxin [Candidatus Shapirobacteria bacterium]
MNKIYFYKSNSGREIIINEIENLDKQSISRVRQAIRLFEEYGLSLINTKWIKKINQQPAIYELRITGSKQIRLLFSEISSSEFIFLSIFVKKTQKTPQREIETAVHRLLEFI